MSLSARDQLILSEIERHLSAGDPRLARALQKGRLPTLSRRLARVGVCRWSHGRTWMSLVIVAFLLIGIAGLTAGMVLGSSALACAGIVTAELSPACLGLAMWRLRAGRQ
ncbi:MAG: DUF3040 domain-containing protein [Streptosporangiaceae bacterium]